MDNNRASSSTYYTDMYWISTATVRVVYRGYHDASAVGGVSNADAYYDASYASASIGSRLAFRGKIVRAQSVAAYKALLGIGAQRLHHAAEHGMVLGLSLIHI